MAAVEQMEGGEVGGEDAGEADAQQEYAQGEQGQGEEGQGVEYDQAGAEGVEYPGAGKRAGFKRVWGRQLVVRGQLHLPTVKLVMRVARVAPKRARCFNSKATSFHVVCLSSST